MIGGGGGGWEVAGGRGVSGQDQKVGLVLVLSYPPQARCEKGGGC